jgi:hypothetical protein
VTLPRPKGGSNREYTADLHTGGVLPTRPQTPTSAFVGSDSLTLSVPVGLHSLPVSSDSSSRARKHRERARPQCQWLCATRMVSTLYAKRTPQWHTVFGRATRQGIGALSLVPMCGLRAPRRPSAVAARRCALAWSPGAGPHDGRLTRVEYFRHRPPAPRPSLCPTRRASRLSSIDHVGSFDHTLDEGSAWHGTCPHIRDQRLHPSVLWRRTLSREDTCSSVVSTVCVRGSPHGSGQDRHTTRCLPSPGSLSGSPRVAGHH